MQHSPQLKFVRVWMSAPTFDRITIDSRVKMVDYISSIGGTMGLFTGFSIISGVEIIYFLIKGIISLMKSKTEEAKSKMEP